MIARPPPIEVRLPCPYHRAKALQNVSSPFSLLVPFQRRRITNSLNRVSQLPNFAQRAVVGIFVLNPSLIDWGNVICGGGYFYYFTFTLSPPLPTSDQPFM
eukprot:TRINITY_DN31279_c0_g1_i1.p1 TRINITY_DN31279_c0_g1~~TRINITY_DN31279_c0_g1_i1.p1  ORF type:complete len:101 (+),score=5.50 TRINITY_DN31279_c0_g1_i1:532-834(+)